MLQIFASLLVLATLNSPLQSSLDKFCSNATPDECQQLTDAVKSSPKLVSQLNELSSEGLLKYFAVVTQENAPTLRNRKYAAATIDGSIVLTNEFLTQVKNNHLYDVRSSTDIYPNSLVFALGHLAYHTKTAAALNEFEENWKREVSAQMKATSKNAQFDGTALVMKSQRKHLEDEAAAYIQGWNDMIDAAVNANDGKSVLLQIPKLLMNFRYGQTFVISMKQPGNSIVITEDGLVELNEHNINAVFQALGTSAVRDVQ